MYKYVIQLVLNKCLILSAKLHELRYCIMNISWHWEKGEGVVIGVVKLIWTFEHKTYNTSVYRWHIICTKNGVVVKLLHVVNLFFVDSCLRLFTFHKASMALSCSVFLFRWGGVIIDGIKLVWTFQYKAYNTSAFRLHALKWDGGKIAMLC